jgi:GNAT superfamily N-acetyltransferase
MGSTELDAPVHVVETLGALDHETLAMLDALVVQSGWNQTAEDWALFSQQGTLFAVRDGEGHEGRIVASGAVLPMGDASAWISMILVAPALRGQGLGRTVFEQCLREVRRQGRVALLDATPAGERLYTQYGFAPLWRLTRWQRAATAPTAALARQEPAGLAHLAALDAEALGLARGGVLAHLAGRAGSRLQRHAQGFAIVRAGRIAHQIGPLVATDEARHARAAARAARRRRLHAAARLRAHGPGRTRARRPDRLPPRHRRPRVRLSAPTLFQEFRWPCNDPIFPPTCWRCWRRAR